MNARNLYLTYPRCSATKEQIITCLISIFELKGRIIENWIVSLEKHADGTPHAHLVLWLDGKVNIRDANFADMFIGEVNFHGNYQALKMEKQCVIYVTKEFDWDTNNHLRIKNIVEGKKKVTDQIANLIMSGQTIRDISNTFPGLVMMNLSRLRRYQVWWNTTNWLSMPLPPINLNPSLTESAILYWMATNMWNYERELRRPQLYLNGLPGSGKSSMIMKMEKTFKTFKPSYDLLWWDGFDETIELIVFDEFKGQIRATSMNKILDGQVMIIPRRGGDFQKIKNIPVIICSNFPPEEVYHRNDSIEAFIGRLKVINIDRYFNIFK